MSPFKYRPTFEKVKGPLILNFLCCVIGAHLYVTHYSTDPLLVLDQLVNISLVVAIVALRWLRCTDPSLLRWPVGAQQPILRRKPSAAP